jgi:hypothetical protein
MAMAPPEYPVKVGSMLYTLVDPNPGHEVAYNRWYERDHFYAGCMIGPWMFAGSRWVATRELKDLRIPQDETNEITIPWDAGSYVAIYWVLQDHEDEHWKWAGEQVHWLYANDRGFAERTHRHTVLYTYVDTIYRDDDPVPIELALDHHYEGKVSVALDRADGVSEADLDAWLRTEGIPPLLAGSAIAMGSIWTPVQRDEITSNSPMNLGSGTGGENRTLQMFFSETDVRESWDRFVDYVARVNASGLATVVFAAPFHRTIIGTDTYTDQLW